MPRAVAILVGFILFTLSGCDVLPDDIGVVPDNITDTPAVLAEEGEGNFFVHRGGHDENFGTKDEPFATIQRGINAASFAGGGNVYVAGGIYKEVVALKSRVNVYGGFDSSTWERDLRRFPSTIEGDLLNGVGVTVIAEDIASVIFNGFTLISPDTEKNNELVPMGNPSIGMLINNGQVITISNNIIIAGNAAEGRPGAVGQDGSTVPPPGEPGTDAEGCATISLGGNGGSALGFTDGGKGGDGRIDEGINGSPGANTLLANGSVIPGGAGGRGGVVEEDGENGAEGATGLDGVHGLGGRPFEPGARGEDGSNGGGGGGGGSGGGALTAACGASGGGGGSGGQGGQGGQGGNAGGSSFGMIVVLNSDVEILNNMIVPGDGGSGGEGGAGGQGGPGGAGGVGGLRFDTQGAGGTGGFGGTGGAGGHGGGGAGGWSIGIYYDGSSRVLRTDNAFTLGAPGLSGLVPEGGNVGEDGDQVEVYQPQPDESLILLSEKIQGILVE